MSIDYNVPAATQITVHPPKQLKPAAEAKQDTTSGDQNSFWGADGFGFDDLIDLVNPLQHIPGVSAIYRELTGDTIAPGPRMVGGAVLGGVVGLVASAANVIMEQESGKDIGEQIFALFDSDDTTKATDSTPTTLTASDKTAATGAPRELIPALPFPAVTAQQPAAPQPPAPGEEKTILQLFGQSLQGAKQSYQQAQSLAFAQEVTKHVHSV